jgi:hypothetical protein
LKYVRDASYIEKIYESVWPVLMMRLNDGSGSQYRHAMKSLAVIRHLLVRGSLRVLTDIHSLLPNMIISLLDHEHISVRAQAVAVYRLSNDVSFYQRSRRHQSVKHDEKTVQRIRITSSTSFIKLHNSMRPPKMRKMSLLKRPSSLLLDIGDNDDGSGLSNDDSFWGDTTSTTLDSIEVKKKTKDATLDLMDLFGGGDITNSQLKKNNNIVEEEDLLDASFFGEDAASSLGGMNTKKKDDDDDDDDAFANFDDEWDLPPIA